MRDPLRENTPSKRRLHVAFGVLATAALVATLVVSAQGEVLGTSQVESVYSAVVPVVEVVPDPEALTDFIALADTDANVQAGLLATRVEALSERFAITDRPRRESIVVELERGQSILQLRRRWSLRQEMLEAMNPGVDLRNPEPGTPITVWRYDPETPGRSVGRPNRGRLLTAELMPEGEGWVVRNDRSAWGAEQTIDALVHAARVVEAVHGDGQDIMIADLSTRRGGSFRPHRSHQSGRDVDATFYRNDTDEAVWSRTRPSELDAARTWTFVRTLLTQHDVTYIFMSRRLISALYSYAESVGEHPAFLDEHFQYGPGHRNQRATIRFAAGHHDHMHIRFGCSEDDVRCRGAR